MELNHDFIVPVPVDRAWPVLLDVERVAPCMPGATLDSAEGDHFTGRLKVKLGAMTITYKGSVHIASQDDQAHTVTIEGTGKEARGSGTASATVHARLHGEGDQTRVTVQTKLNITGRPAQFGRNILSEVGGKVISRFADNLAAELARDEAAEAAPAPEAGSGAAAPATEPAPVTDATPETRTARVPGAGANGGAGTTGAESAATARPNRAAQDAGSVAKASPPADAVSPGTGSATPRPRASGESATPATARPAGRQPDRRSEDAIDLLEVVGPSMAKRAIPLLIGVAGVVLLRRIFRRSRG